MILALTLIAYLVLGYGYATLTPIWQNPDEPAHFNYVAQVAQTGTLPELKPGDWDSALLSRVQNGQLGPGDSIATIRYESWQPPLYYLLAAPAFLIGPADLPAQVLRLRLFGVLLGALTLVLAYFVARRVMPEPLALVVPVAMVGVPMFSAVSAAVSADPLANALAALLTLALVRGRFEPVRTGALLGLGVLTKLALVIFGPLAVWLLVRRSARPVRDIALLCVVSALVLVPWLIHQVTTYGWLDPLATTRHAAVVFDQPRFEGFTATNVWDFATISFHSFWAQFGWMGVVAPDRLYWTWGALTLLAVGGLTWRRTWLREPAWQILLAIVVSAFVAYIVYNLSFKQFQGRYLFTALVPIASLLVGGWSAWWPVRLKVVGPAATAALLVGLNAYALVRVVVPGFAPPG